MKSTKEQNESKERTKNPERKSKTKQLTTKQIFKKKS